RGVAEAFGLTPEDLDPHLPLQVVSTGLRYLVVPLVPGAMQCARVVSNLDARLRSHDAQYAVLFDENALEQRHWSNDGVLEDVATGSAAGVIGAYRLLHGLAVAGKTFILDQGRFVGRPSELFVTPKTNGRGRIEVDVGGTVSFVGGGTLEALP